MEWLIPAAQAHEKWFVPAGTRLYDIPAFFNSWNKVTVAALAGIAVVTLAGYLADYWFEMSATYETFEKRIHRLRDYAAGALAVSTGIVLLWSAYKGVLLADNFVLPAGAVGPILRAVEALIGLFFLIGLFTPIASVGLIGLFFAALALFPFPDPLDYANFVGIGIFLFYFSRGRFSLDWFLGKPIFSTPEQRKSAYLALRVITGVTFLILALGKWLRPDLHLGLMDRYPDFNPYVILQAIGLAMSREMYVFLLFVIELTVGIFVLGGFLTRVAAIALVPVFVGSIIFLGPLELIGHLPILGTLFVFFVYGDKYHKDVVATPPVKAAQK